MPLKFEIISIANMILSLIAYDTYVALRDVQHIYIGPHETLLNAIKIASLIAVALFAFLAISGAGHGSLWAVALMIPFATMFKTASVILERCSREDGTNTDHARAKLCLATKAFLFVPAINVASILFAKVRRASVENLVDKDDKNRDDERDDRDDDDRDVKLEGGG
jgi:hypothetical protein